MHCQVKGLKNRDILDPIFNEPFVQGGQLEGVAGQSLNVAHWPEGQRCPKRPLAAWIRPLCCALDAHRFIVWPCASMRFDPWSEWPAVCLAGLSGHLLDGIRSQGGKNGRRMVGARPDRGEPGSCCQAALVLSSEKRFEPTLSGYRIASPTSK